MTELEKQLLNSLEQMQKDSSKKHQAFLTASSNLKTMYEDISAQYRANQEQVTSLLEQLETQRKATESKISSLTEQVNNLADQVSRLKK